MALSATPGPDPEPGLGPGGGPGSGRAEDADLLPCGRTLHEVWDAWDEDRAAGDPHYAACPHCTAALHGLRMLDGFVRAARTADEEERRADGGADGGRAAHSVTARVMDIVRHELRPGRSVPMGGPDEEAWIVEAAAARAFRSAVDGMPGVRAGSCRIVPEPAEPVVRVRVEVAADLSRSFPEWADLVRERVVAAAREVVGLEVASVDVAVVDVLVDDDGERTAAGVRGRSDPGSPGPERPDGTAGDATDGGGER